MFRKMQKSIGLPLLVGVFAIVGFAADESDTRKETKYPFSVKFIDENGKPVEGAMAGVCAFYFDEPNPQLITDDAGWQYSRGRSATTNAEGIANFPDGQKRSDGACLVARQTDQKLVAIWKINSEKLDWEKTPEMLTVTMHPACRVSGRLGCDDLKNRNRDIGWTNVYLNSGGNRAFGCSSNDQTFHFFVPPGEYGLDLYGVNLHHVDKPFSVKAGQRELDFGTIELSATRLALLVGQPAPKLAGIKCWKNGPAVELENLKGKCVILDFWGYWCGPCVHRMPVLFKLYDKYHDEGLEIVGIHVDLGEREKEPVDSVEKLDERLTTIRKELWDGRDVPFPVGLVLGTPTSYGTAIETHKARSEMSAQYGVTGYPTQILIDRQGNVVGIFHAGFPEDTALLEKVLKDK